MSLTHSRSFAPPGQAKRFHKLAPDPESGIVMKFIAVRESGSSLILRLPPRGFSMERILGMFDFVPPPVVFVLIVLVAGTTVLAIRSAYRAWRSQKGVGRERPVEHSQRG